MGLEIERRTVLELTVSVLSTEVQMGYEQWYDVVRLVMDIKQGRRKCVLPIFDPTGKVIGRLEPLTLGHIGNTILIRQFVRWRNQNLEGYLDQRPTTEIETAKWLVDVATNPTRIAFLIYAGDKLVGRCGNVQMRPWELMSDGLVRGERGGGIDFIHYSQVAAIIWTFRKLGIEAIHSKLLSTNDAAHESCKRLACDMTAYRSAPLYRKESEVGVYLEEHGLPTELVPDQLLYYVRLHREPFFQLMSQTPGFMALDQLISNAD